MDLQHAIETNRWTYDLMQYLYHQANFIHDSRKRLDLIKKFYHDLHQDDHLSADIRRPVCPTRWVRRGKLLPATLDEYDVLIQVMKSLADTAEVKTAAIARNFLFIYFFSYLG